jgi:hypothetical protein
LINNAPYTVKHVTNRSTLTLTTNYAAGGQPDATVIWYKYVELRIYANSAFQPAGKTYIVQPGAPGSGAWHRRIAASVVNELGVNNLYIPEMSGAMALDATTDSPTNQAARYYAAFYRPEGGLIQAYECFGSFSLPPVSPTTWPDICTFNQRQVVVQDDATYTKTQIDAMRTPCTTGQGLFYASTGLKPACLNFGAGLTLAGNTLSSLTANGYATILNNGTPLTQRSALNFLAPSFVVTDNGGTQRTEVNLDGDLNALAQLTGNGGAFRIGVNTWALRTLTGAAGQVSVVNGDGVPGNPTVSLPTTVFLGTPGGSPAAGALTGPDASGTDIAGANLELHGGKGTGAGVPGQVVLRYPLQGATGSTLQSLSTDRFPVSTSIYTNITSGTAVANTTAETSMFTGATASAGSMLTIQAGSTASGSVYRIQILGNVGTTGTPTIQIRLKFGSTTIADSTAFATPNNASGVFFLDAIIYVAPAGAAGIVRVRLRGEMTAAASGAVTPVVFVSSGTAVGVDFTANQTIDVTAQWGAASPSNTIGLFRASIERIR